MLLPAGVLNAQMALMLKLLQPLHRHVKCPPAPQVFLHAQMALRLAGYHAKKQPGAILEEVVDMARSVGIVDGQGGSWKSAVQ